MKRLPRPTRRGWSLLVAAATLIVAGAATGFADVIRAGIFGLALVVLAALITLVRPRRLMVSRSAPARLQAGRTEHVNVAVQSRTGTWTSCTLREAHTIAGAEGARWSFDRLPGGTTNLSYAVTPPRRGEYTAGPLVMETVDPLRLVHSDTEHGHPDRWLVWPRIHDSEGSAARHRGDGDDELVSAHASQAGQAGASVREYAQGDDMRIVHWPATAHRGDLMVRQFDPPAQLMTRIFVHGNVPQTETDPTWEHLLSAAASTCVHLSARCVPLSVSVGSRRVETAQEALDELAAVTSSTPDDLDLRPAPTLLFHHTSVPVSLPPPRHVPAIAVIAGNASAMAATRLGALGWDVHVLTPSDDIAHAVEDLLAAFEGNR